MGLFGGSIAKDFMGRTNKAPVKTVSTGKLSNGERMKYMYQSLNALNDILIYALKHKNEYINGYDEEKVQKHLGIIAGSIEDLTEELKKTNENLTKLRSTKGLVQVALSGGADQILENLSWTINEITNNVTTLLDFLKRNGRIKGKSKEPEPEKEPEQTVGLTVEGEEDGK